MSTNPSTRLGTPKSAFRLNQIDKIRAIGIGDHISLPQLVVCGDQSAGKSSVLERLTGIPFPRQDGLCTRFATEIILRHSTKPLEITASIRTDYSRSCEDRETLDNYWKKIPDLSALPQTIEEAAKLMGIRGYSDSESGNAFALDALRITVSGPTGLHLTIVDLPGLISVENEEQTKRDVEVVHQLVENYIRSPRTIILAVIQAGNDIANQPIITKARGFDIDGLRTVGIITKPDLINKGTEGRIARLANNKDNIKLGLGFFLLKNPTPQELESGLSFDDASLLEQDFFSMPAWKEHAVDPERVGASRLKEFVQNLLYEHIEKEIPKVKEEIKQKLVEVEGRLLRLGLERPNLHHIRSFLIETSMRFHQLAQDSLNGNYLGVDAEFFKNDTRLRALIHHENGKFSDHMRVNGSKRKMSSRSTNEDHDNQSTEGVETNQLHVTKQEMMEWVEQIYVRTRGLELPGNYNHMLLSELVQEQSSPWIIIAKRHVDTIVSLVRGWLEQALMSTIHEEGLRHDVLSLCQDRLEQACSLAHEELSRLWDDERKQPITYNHYFTDNIHNARNDFQKKAVQAALQDAIQEDWHGKFHISNNPDDINRISSVLQNRVVVNMDNRACQEGFDGMEAYYKLSQVSRKTFVDNVCRQVVERHIITPIPTFFSPRTVSQLSDEEVVRIGSEPERQKLQRAQLCSFADRLRIGLKELNLSPPS
ncbi:putative dynamin GTPase [Colletotrichum eremochloae]|nr:putative dynamin GTPase [Colletotrichum eremochloae]